MMRPYGEDLKIYLHRAPIDMRRGRNGLAALAQEVLKVDPFSGAMFVYVGRRFNALKILYWTLMDLPCGARKSRAQRSITGRGCCRKMS
jgi:transposase